MKWTRRPSGSASVDETSSEWDELWHVTGHRPPDGEPGWIGLLSNRPEFSPGQPHYSPNVLAKVAGFDADRLSTTKDGWEVAVKYRRQLDEAEQNPLERPAEIDLDSESEEVPIDRNADGQPILSSAGGLIAGLTEEENRWIFNIAKNVPDIPKWIIPYRNAVNSDAVRIGGLNIDPGYLLLKNPRGGKPQTAKVRGQEIEYRELTFSLIYNPNSWLTRFYDRDLYELGEVEVQVPSPTGSTDADGNPVLLSKMVVQRVRMTAKNDQGEDVEVDEPQFLDGSGRRPRNQDGTIKAPLEPEDIVTREEWTKKRLPFRALPLS
jgi:hypothetical protein